MATCPTAIRAGEAAGSPTSPSTTMHGLVAMAQISAIELHAWGATEADPLHPDFMVFDLDPGEGVAFADVVRAATDVRDRLKQLGLRVLLPHHRRQGPARRRAARSRQPSWDAVKPFCRAFAETLSEEQPDRFLPTMKKVDRRGRILIDWLRNGLGATAVASFCPRARPGATVATPLAWDEVTPKLDPSAFTLDTRAGQAGAATARSVGRVCRIAAKTAGSVCQAGRAFSASVAPRTRARLARL